MVFSSLLFVFLFLALNLVSQAALRGARQKNIAMLLFSLVFFSWAGPRYVVLLLLDTALCWFFAICIEREPQRKKLHLSLCVALVLLVLLSPVFLVLAIAIWGGMYWVSKQFCKKHDIN